MRRIGLALFALAGCNQVFGIKDTATEPDAAPPMFVGHMNWLAPQGSGTVVFPIGGEAVDPDDAVPGQRDVEPLGGCVALVLDGDRVEAERRDHEIG